MWGKKGFWSKPIFLAKNSSPNLWRKEKSLSSSLPPTFTQIPRGRPQLGKKERSAKERVKGFSLKTALERAPLIFSSSWLDAWPKKKSVKWKLSGGKGRPGSFLTKETKEEIISSGKRRAKKSRLFLIFPAILKNKINLLTFCLGSVL